jgi:CheY-like chemotaxis protein
MSHSYSAALSNFKPGLYDLALLDIRMPKMYGNELYEEMKKIDDILRSFG